MITQCSCGQMLRDCSVPAGGGYVTGWYHIGTGWETCEGGNTMARPAKLVSIRCPVHRKRPVDGCVMCLTSYEAGIYFHNLGRCIPDLCLFPHY